GKLLVYNQPVYDLMIVPKEAKVKDTLAFINLLGLTKEEFVQKMEAARNYSYVKPYVFMKQLSSESFAKIQGSLIDYPGFHVQPRIVRAYPYKALANQFG